MAPAASKLKGRLCSLTDAGKRVFSDEQDRIGIIEGESRDKKCFRVHWHGRGKTSIDVLNKNFIQLFE